MPEIIQREARRFAVAVIAVLCLTTGALAALRLSTDEPPMAGRSCCASGAACQACAEAICVDVERVVYVPGLHGQASCTAVCRTHRIDRWFGWAARIVQTIGC